MAFTAAIRQESGLARDRPIVPVSRFCVPFLGARPILHHVSRPIIIRETVPPDDPPVSALFERCTRCYHYEYNENYVPNTCREYGA